MSVYVFTGPTLSPQVGKNVLKAVYLPPVSQGDVYRITLKRPRAVGIIDGYFERMPSVWHKEILWAMKQGIHVFGAASMGALRAAELEPFGMVGVGVIFEAYRSGSLEDDDEVAVVHGPPEVAFRAASEAMVNIRWTLRAAVADEVIQPSTYETLLDIAKSLFYPSRNYPYILSRGAEEGLPTDVLNKLRDWLPSGKVDRKREDALAMLSVIREFLSGNPESKHVHYPFQYTEMWDHACRLAGQLHSGPNGTWETIELDTLLDELRLESGHNPRVRDRAIARLLSLEETYRQGLVVSRNEIKRTAKAFRRDRGLQQQENLKDWMEDNHLDQGEFAAMMEEQARLNWVETMVDQEFLAHVPNHLRTLGIYARLSARAALKQRLLERVGLENPGLDDVGLTYEELLSWYFVERLGRRVPTDVIAYAHSAGFADEDAFRRALIREFSFRCKLEAYPE